MKSAPSALPEEAPNGLTCGVDWARDDHAVAVVDTRETTQYIAVLSAADSAFARAWSRYRPIAAFDGLVVYKKGRAGCLDVWVAAEPAH